MFRTSIRDNAVNIYAAHHAATIVNNIVNTIKSANNCQANVDHEGNLKYSIERCASLSHLDNVESITLAVKKEAEVRYMNRGMSDSVYNLFKNL